MNRKCIELTVVLKFVLMNPYTIITSNVNNLH